MSLGERPCMFRKKNNGERCGESYHATAFITIQGSPTPSELPLCYYHYNLYWEDPYEFRELLVAGINQLLESK